MSVRVNLLPGEVQARGEATRARIVAAVLGLLLLVVLAGLTFLQRSEIGDAEDRLAAVQTSNEELRADIAALQPFADLEARAQTSVDVVGLALGAEKSFATVMQDLSAVLPPTAELQNLTLQFLPQPAQPAPGGARLVHGQITATGRVLAGVAPGVERLVVDLERVAAFDNVFVTTSVVDEEGVATFTIEAQFGPEVLTRRYEVTDTGASS